MDIPAFLKSLEASGIATTIRESLLWFPLVESAHVIGLALVFGTIAIIDLRLLGVASARRSFQTMASDILKWTWVGFALTVITGILMFITNAGVYFNNTYFRVKILLVVLAGINMLVFELTAGRAIHQWEKDPAAPTAGKAAAVLSIAIWIGVILFGRLTGFTTSRAAQVEPPPAGVDFDDFLNDAPPAAPSPKK